MKKKKPNSGVNPQWSENRKKQTGQASPRKSWYLEVPWSDKPVWLPNFTDMDKFERWYDNQVKRNDCLGCGWCLECRRRDEALGMYPVKPEPPSPASPSSASPHSFPPVSPTEPSKDSDCAKSGPLSSGFAPEIPAATPLNL